MLFVHCVVRNTALIATGVSVAALFFIIGFVVCLCRYVDDLNEKGVVVLSLTRKCDLLRASVLGSE